MSSEWKTVESNRKSKKVCEVHIPQPQQQVRPPQVRQPTRQQIENERREKWEQRRHQKIDEYNKEFPLLPGSRDLVPDAQKIAYIDGKFAAKKEADHKAYLEREARRQAKRQRDQEFAAVREQRHIENMIEKWGAHRWYRMVEHTNDDCNTAYSLRVQEEEREWRMEYLRRERESRWEEEEKNRKIEREKYIAEQTANMSQHQKETWIDEFVEQELEELEDAAYAEGNRMYESYLNWEAQKIEDNERLEAWNAKHQKK